MNGRLGSPSVCQHRTFHQNRLAAISVYICNGNRATIGASLHPSSYGKVPLVLLQNNRGWGQTRFHRSSIALAGVTVRADGRCICVQSIVRSAGGRLGVTGGACPVGTTGSRTFVQQRLGVDSRADNGDDSPGPPATRTIFRIEAYQNYVQNKERVVFPRLASARGFIALWIVAGLLMIIGLTVAFWPMLQPYLIGSP